MTIQKRREFIAGIAWTLPVWILVIAALGVHP
jgi:hypothetical protein